MKKDKVEKILEETRAIYDQIAPDFALTRNKKWQLAFGDFDKYVKGGGMVLDLGCGSGRMAELFRDSKASYLGLDNSKELLEQAKVKFQDFKNISFEFGDVIELDNFLDESKGKFNLVLMMAVLHHIPTRELRLKVLKDINSLMKPGATLVMYNWNLWQWSYRKKYWTRLLDYKFKISKGVWSLKDAFIPWKPIGNDSQRYVHSFTRGELRSLLVQAGFEIDKLAYASHGQPASFFNGYNSVAIARKK